PAPCACARWGRRRAGGPVTAWRAAAAGGCGRASSSAQQPDVLRARIEHAQLLPRLFVDAARLGERGLLQFEFAVFDVHVVALVLQRGELDEQHAALVARPHHADRAGQHGGQQRKHEEGLDQPHAEPTFCATRNTAERARGFATSSASEGNCALPTATSSADFAATGGPRRLPSTRPEWSRMNCLTMRFSCKWKLITASRPPGFRRASAASSPRRTESSSPFTRMRSAWKLRVAGCLPGSRRPTTRSISAASSPVRMSGLSARRSTMARAILRLKRSSPYCHSTS